MSKDKLWLLKEKYGGVESEAFHADRQRVAPGGPLGYVIGFVPFLDCKIWLDSKPLIPRPETEFWVEKAIAEIKARPRSLSKPSINDHKVRAAEGSAEGSPPQLQRAALCNVKILDLCAGSGCIGVAVAKAIPEAHVTFAEIDPAHLPTIGKNLEKNGIDCTRYKVFQSDLFNGLPNKYSEIEKAVVLDEMQGTGEFLKEPYEQYGEEKIGTRNAADRQNHCFFDFILCNPPYVDPKLDRTEPSVKNHEPHQALYGGEDGMELIAKIISESPAHLRSNGQLWFEHEPEQISQIDHLATKSNFVATTHKDQYGLERYSVLMLQ